MAKDPLIGWREVVGMIGLLLLAAGLAMVSIPLALIVCGALLFAVAVVPLMLPTGKGG